MYQAFEMNYKNNQGYVKIYPNTTTEQVMGYNLGEVYGPYQVTLSANGWIESETTAYQDVSLSDVRDTDYVVCINILSGTEENMIAQDKAYCFIGRVLSSNGSLRFIAKGEQNPDVDLTVQVSWIR